MVSVELIGIEDVMGILKVSRKEATRILNMPGCPKLPRTKGQRFRVVKEPFLAWVAGDLISGNMEE